MSATREELVVRLRDMLQDIVVEERDWEKVGPESTIEDLGLDSLTVLDLLYDVEQEFSVEIDPEVMMEARTLGDVAGLLQERGV